MILAGMHRSGTSVTSQWLQRCNLHIGDELLGPAAGNIEGHFEDAAFVRAHEEILKSAGLPESGLTDIILTDFPEEEVQHISEIISHHNADHKQWGWKDPRTCLFLPMYRELLPSANYLVIFRDFNSAVSSLIHRMYLWQEEHYKQNWIKRLQWRRNKYKIHNKLYTEYSEQYLKIWITYNRNILKHIQQLSPDSFLVTNYKDLRKNNRTIFSHLKEKWGYNLTYVDYNKVFKETLMTPPEPIENYIKDSSLIKEARRIEDKLRGYIK